MDINDYHDLTDEELKEDLRRLSRSQLDERLHWFGGQHALLCQRLEALFSPDRLEHFISIRPGGLDEIDKAILLAQDGNPKELALLKSFRELNRILQPFMDIYEEAVLKELQYMSKEELEALDANVSKELAMVTQKERSDPANYRAAQNAAGTLRLAGLMKENITRELKDRFGVEPE